MYIFKIKGLCWHDSFKTSIAVFSCTLCHFHFPSLLQWWELAFPASSTKYLLIHFLLQHTCHLVITTSLPWSTISLTKIHNIFLLFSKYIPQRVDGVLYLKDLWIIFLGAVCYKFDACLGPYCSVWIHYYFPFLN